MSVVVAAPTGVVYEQQCGGVSSELCKLEGYLVPLGGAMREAGAGMIDPAKFTQVFHHGEHCVYGECGAPLEADRLQRLRRLVADIPFWTTDGAKDIRQNLSLDEARLAELAEAWVPVQTPDGPGVLLWKNCD